MAQVRRRNIANSDDSPETLDKGLWQFDAYDPASCFTASVFTPITPWPQSTTSSQSLSPISNDAAGDLQEEALHFKVAGVLMRQNLKVCNTIATLALSSPVCSCSWWQRNS